MSARGLPLWLVPQADTILRPSFLRPVVPLGAGFQLALMPRQYRPLMLATPPQTRFGLMLVLAALTAAGGCVERRMTIRSNPPGAMVYVDDYEIGTTPVSTSYIYYGTRKIRLVKDGYETLTIYQPMPTPWYEWLGIDFVSENLWPHKIRDERSFMYQMQPMVVVPPETLLDRAQQLREANRSIPAAPPAPVATPPVMELPPPATAFPPATLPPSSPFPAPMVSPAPSPGFSTPPGAIPNYAPPGGTAPAAPPVLPGQPLPPDWRPIGQAPTAIQR